MYIFRISTAYIPEAVDTKDKSVGISCLLSEVMDHNLLWTYYTYLPPDDCTEDILNRHVEKGGEMRMETNFKPKEKVSCL